jgi:glycosyltransferase involved in cell wall biosynthesis
MPIYRTKGEGNSEPMKAVRQEQLISSFACPDKNSSSESSVTSISIVVPAYCEEGNLPALYEELYQVLTSVKVCWEMIVVDDGSTDGTWRQITDLHRRDARVKGLRLSRNFGHQYALLAGLSNATGQVVITMDADLQHPPEVIVRLLEQWREGRQIVHTVRTDHRNLPILKRITSRIFYKIFGSLSGVKLSAGMADFRLLDRQVVDELVGFKEGGLFLRGLVQWVGYSSSQIEFECRERFTGKTKYNVAKMLRFAWAGVTSFSLIPLRIAIVLGFITSAVAFINLSYAVGVKLFTERAVPGWASAVSIISLLFGVLFILLGIIGEYIGRVLEEVRDRPRFIISERTGFMALDPALGEPSASIRKDNHQTRGYVAR